MLLHNASCQMTFVNTDANEEGYTLIEFIVVFLIVSIVSTAAAGIYVYAHKWIHKWQVNLALENSGHLLMSQVSRDLRHADAIDLVNDSLWVLQFKGKDELQYLFADSSVYRNGLAFGSNDVLVQSFSIREDSSFYKNEQVGISGERKMISLGLVLKLEKSTMSLQSRIHMRQQEPWSKYIFVTDTTEVFNQGAAEIYPRLVVP